MLKRIEIDDDPNQFEHFQTREKAKHTLIKLQSLKNKISELRLQCEELKKLRSEYQEKYQEKEMICDECGERIDPGEEVEVKNSKGIERRHYHKECFKAMWM